VHSADGWKDVLEPVVTRYRDKVSRLYFRADAATSRCFSSRLQRRRRSTRVITSTEFIVLRIRSPYAQHFPTIPHSEQGSRQKTLTVEAATVAVVTSPCPGWSS